MSDAPKEIVFKIPIQIGDTETLLNWIDVIIDEYPEPFMIVWPTSEMAKRISKQRVTGG